MRKKLSLTRGTLGLALAASALIGCQDFLGGDKGGRAATPPAEDVQHAAQAVSPEDSAKDAAAGPQAPVASAPGTLEECRYLWSEMQNKSASEAYYMDVKYKFIGKNCAQVIGDANPTQPPPPPLDSAALCRNIEEVLANLDSASPKFPYYRDLYATDCGGAPSSIPAKPGDPVAPDKPKPVDPTPPASKSPLSPQQEECLDLYNQLQSAKEPAYGEAKNQYGEKNCDAVLGDAKPVPVYTPPTLEERCRMYRINLAQTQPVGDPKWQSYLDEMAVTCAAYP